MFLCIKLNRASRIFTKNNVSNPSKQIADISPQGRVISSEIQKSVFNRSYMAFLFVLLGTCVLLGYTISQNYETQKDLQELKAEYELNTLIRLKQEGKK